MSPSRTSITPGVLLAERLIAQRGAYASAAPWPHALVDDAAPDDLIAAALEELTASGLAGLDQVRTRRQVKAQSTQLPPATARLMAWLESDTIRDALGRLTGIADLCADPTHTLAGVHVTATGGFTKVHRDFDRHPVDGRHHRVNVLLYLTGGDDPAEGGSLELWPPNMRSLGRAIPTRRNRVVVFETHAATWHGLPTPVATAEPRISLASYWYSADPQPGAGLLTAVTPYRARPGESRWIGAASGSELLRQGWNRLPSPVRQSVRRAARRH